MGYVGFEVDVAVVVVAVAAAQAREGTKEKARRTSATRLTNTLVVAMAGVTTKRGGRGGEGG